MKKLLLMAVAALCFGCATNQEKPMEENSNVVTENLEKTFQKIDPKEISDNAVQLIGFDWMLLTAGKKDDFNMMTASWGTLGFLWNEPVIFTFVRPQRHTFNFTEKDDYFTISIFEEKDRDILQFCGTKSGKDYDKIKETGLIPLETELGNVYYEQARLVIECKKVYADYLKEDAFIDSTFAGKYYPEKDFHKMYVGKIVNVWEKK